jgi:hypothetical protein
MSGPSPPPIMSGQLQQRPCKCIPVLLTCVGGGGAGDEREWGRGGVGQGMRGSGEGEEWGRG